MFDFQSVPLPDYTRAEDTVNSVTHALGVPLVIVMTVLCFLKPGAQLPGVRVAGLLLCCFASVLMYAGSAFYHGLRPSPTKRVARVLDHSNIFMMIAGTLTAFYLLGVYQSNRALAVGLCAASWVISVVGIVLTFMDLHKFRKLQMAMYLVLGWSAVIGFFNVWRLGENGKHFVILVAVGGVLYSVGAILYGVGKKIRYIHAVFHVFILAATAIQLFGIYKYMM